MPLEFCRQAEANMNTCKARWASMGPVDGTSHSRSGQAGAFADCYFLYQKAFGMCRINAGLAALRKPASVAAPTPPAVPKTPPANPPQGSRSPPPPTQSSGPALSPQCQTLVSNYVGAAQAGDGSRAVAGYNALKQAGGCGVLAKVDRPLPAAPAAPAVDDSRFEARGATPLSDQVVGGCDASPDECARRVRQLQAGTSPEAKAALMSHAIGVGLQLGNALGGAVLSAVPTSVPTAGGGVAVPSGGGSNMNSIGNKPVRSTYGQGAPTGVAPPYRPSDITGTK
jgi:hypothetical protein